MCLFTDSLEPSGVGEHMLTLAACRPAGDQLALVCPPTPSGSQLLERARALGLETLALAVRDQDAERQLARWLGARRFDLFHCHAGIGWEGHHGIYAARTAGVPRVVRTEHLPHLLTDPDQCLDHRRVVGQVDRVICVSEGARATFLRAGIPAERLRVVRNGIEARRWARPGGGDRAEVRETIRGRLGLPAKVPLVLTVGRMVRQKGYQDLLEVVPGVSARRPDARFVWAGEGSLEGELRARARALDVEHAVCFLGRRADVPDLLAAADLFVLPSRFEGLPLVALEAMAAGLPVIGTRVCGTSEVVLDGVTGRLVPPGAAPELTAAILEALEQPERSAQWGAAGRERVEREFSAGRMTRETIAVYEELFHQPAAASDRRQVAANAAEPGAMALASDGE